MRVEPIFFFDGVFRQQKYRTQLQRRQEDAKLAAQLYGQMTHSKQKKTDYGIVLPPLAKEIILQALQSLNVACHQSLGEADGLIASYFRQNQPNAFGVLSNDSDFFIFNVTFFPIDKFVLLQNGDYRFSMFENQETARLLGVDPALLPIVSCLIGNDYTRDHLASSVRYRDLLFTHGRTQVSDKKRTIRSAAAFCSAFLKPGDHAHNMQVIAEKLLKNCSNQKRIVKAFNEALKIIYLDEMDGQLEGGTNNIPDDFVLLYEKCLIDNSLLGIRETNAFWNRVVCLGDMDVTPITRPIRRVLYGMLSNQELVTEYFQEGVRFLSEKVPVEKSLLSLGDLWALPLEERLLHCVEKMVLSGRDDLDVVSELCGLDPRIRLAAISLRYMMHQNESMEEPFLFPWEGSVLLAHLVASHQGLDLKSNGQEPPQKKVSKKMHYLLLKVPVSRTVSVSSVFQSVLLNVLFALQASNAVVGENVLCFNGSDFNHIYHLFYRHVLLRRNEQSERPWSDRMGAKALAEEFVDTIFAEHEGARHLFKKLQRPVLSGMESFRKHFPDEFKLVKKAAPPPESKKFTAAVKATQKGQNPYQLLSFLSDQ